MIDSHCHLNFNSLSNEFDSIISRAIKNNIKAILSINTDPKNFEDHYQLINQYKSLFISFGLHPENVKSDNILTSDDINSYLIKKNVIGIGETGLDFAKSKSNKDLQIKSFENHIESSINTGIPLIIHQRNSENEIIDILKNYQKNNSIRVVFHCFTGSKKLKDFCLDNGYYISLSGIITFKNAEDLRKNIKSVPLNNILVETDSPFLSPVPMRGKQNEPSFIKYTFKFLSELFNVPHEKFIDIINNNFYDLFSKAIRYNQIHQ